MHEVNLSIEEIKVTPASFVGLIGLLQEGVINRPTAKDVLATMFRTGQPAAEIIEERGLARIGNEDQLGDIVTGVLEQHPGPVQQYLDGKETVLRFLVGQVMRATKGTADPQLAAQILKEQLNAMGA
jgi:aspartyl-tRNA(Asn)/glutamyl-tRNA(Gln) amidotransferase subunit B